MFSYLDATPTRPSLEQMLEDYWDLMPEYQVNILTLPSLYFLQSSCQSYSIYRWRAFRECYALLRWNYYYGCDIGSDFFSSDVNTLGVFKEDSLVYG